MLNVLVCKLGYRLELEWSCCDFYLTLFPGTVRHELTSHFAFDSVFKFFDEKIKLAANTGSDVSEDSEQEGDASSQNNMDSAEDPEKTSANNMDASVDPDEKPSENKKDSGADDVDANSQTKGDNPQSQPDDSQMETDI